MEYVQDMEELLLPAEMRQEVERLCLQVQQAAQELPMEQHLLQEVRTER